MGVSVKKFGLNMYASVTFNSLWPGDAIWQYRAGSTSAKVMVWYSNGLVPSLPEPKITSHQCGIYLTAISQWVLQLLFCIVSLEIMLLKLLLYIYIAIYKSFQWRHNRHGSVSNHQPPECLLNRLLRRRSKKTLKLRVTGLCAGNSPGTGEFPAQRANNAENVSIWWRHHG